MELGVPQDGDDRDGEDVEQEQGDRKGRYRANCARELEEKRSDRETNSCGLDARRRQCVRRDRGVVQQARTLIMGRWRISGEERKVKEWKWVMEGNKG